METVTNAASAASKLIFGEKSGEEPVSGKTGKGTPEEPYDQGNRHGECPHSSPPELTLSHPMPVSPTRQPQLNLCESATGIDCMCCAWYHRFIICHFD